MLKTSLHRESHWSPKALQATGQAQLWCGDGQRHLQTLAGDRPSARHHRRQRRVCLYPIRYLNEFIALSMNFTEKSMDFEKNRIYSAVLSLQGLPLFLTRRFLLKVFFFPMCYGVSLVNSCVHTLTVAMWLCAFSCEGVRYVMLFVPANSHRSTLALLMLFRFLQPIQICLGQHFSQS